MDRQDVTPWKTRVRRKSDPAGEPGLVQGLDAADEHAIVHWDSGFLSSEKLDDLDPE